MPKRVTVSRPAAARRDGDGNSDGEDADGGLGDHGDDEAHDAHALNDCGFRRRAAAAPWWWRSEMAFCLGGFPQAVMGLLGEHPHLMSTIMDAFTTGSNATGGLPGVPSVLSSRLVLLGRLCYLYSQLPAATLCFDIAGAAHELLLMVSPTLPR